ncbi:uL30 family ribosomal protein [archaeon]|nr:uL30 family ribosomal protein [archaeon]
MGASKQPRTLFAVIRIRGSVNRKKEEKDTLRMLGLTKPHHMVLIPADNPCYQGMLRKVQHLITWGEIDEDTLRYVIQRKFGLEGEELDRAIQLLLYTEVNPRRIFPIFRLHPPSGGYKGSIKRPYADGGAWGYRGPAINQLLRRMC